MFRRGQLSTEGFVSCEDPRLPARRIPPRAPYLPTHSLSSHLHLNQQARPSSGSFSQHFPQPGGALLGFGFGAAAPCLFALPQAAVVAGQAHFLPVRTSG